MRWGAIIVLGMLALQSAAQDSAVVTGTVTYVAAGTVYTSIGRAQGVLEGSVLRLVKGNDTTAVLRAMAVSSKSSACSVLTTRGQIAVGASVIARVPVEHPAGDPVVSQHAPMPGPEPERPPSGATPPRPDIELKGRVSLQWRSMEYDEESFNLRQPGVVLNLQGKTAAVPLQLDLYANLRTASYGGAGVFSSGAVNQSRVYRASLGYDDGKFALSIGRTLPLQAWTLGTIDGVVVSQRWGVWKIGGAAGFQPEGGNRGVSSTTRKTGLFLSWEPEGSRPGFFTAVYTRTYRLTMLDRETASGLANLALLPGLMLYGNTEVDLRRKEGSAYVLHPQLTSVYLNVNYRLSRMLGVGLGANASRPVFAFSDVRTVPDSLLERRLVWGASLQLSLAPVPGVSVTNTFSPRSRLSGAMGDYVDYAAVTLSEASLTGIVFRADMNLSRSEYTRVTGFGGGVQRQLPAGIDLALRYHRSRYTLLRTGSSSVSTTAGADIVVPLTSTFVLFGTYEWFEGYGTKSRSLMAELSVRF
jgi:hypothetical protein